MYSLPYMRLALVCKLGLTRKGWFQDQKIKDEAVTVFDTGGADFYYYLTRLGLNAALVASFSTRE